MKPTPAMICAAHDVTMKEAGIILSHELIARLTGPKRPEQEYANGTD